MVTAVYRERKKRTQIIDDEKKGIYLIVIKNLLAIKRENKALNLTDEEISKVYLLCNERVLFLLNDIWVNVKEFSLDNNFVKYEIEFLFGYIRSIVGTHETEISQMEFARKTSDTDFYAILKEQSQITVEEKKIDTENEVKKHTKARNVLEEGLSKLPKKKKAKETKEKDYERKK